jgi:hypothetical protein
MHPLHLNRVSPSSYPRSLFPHQHQAAPCSWDDGGDLGEPRFAGCLSLTDLILHSARLTPSVLQQLGVRVPTLRRLGLPGCFNALVTLTYAEALREVMGLSHVQRLDLRACHWLTERAVVKWAGLLGQGGEALPKLRELVLPGAFASHRPELCLLGGAVYS